MGDVVRKLREARQLTQEALADKARIDKSALVRLENESEKSKLETITRVATALDVRLVDYFDYAERLKWFDSFNRLPQDRRQHIADLVLEQAPPDREQSAPGARADEDSSSVTAPAAQKSRKG